MKTYILITIASLFLVGCGNLGMITSGQTQTAGVVHTPNGDIYQTTQSQTAPPSLFQLIFGSAFSYAFSPQGYYFYGNYYTPTVYSPCYAPVGMPPAPYYPYNNYRYYNRCYY